MRHARRDYDRIQDPAGLIPKDEPVFLLRGQDELAPVVLRYYADLARTKSAKQPQRREALTTVASTTDAHADLMERWPKKKLPDLVASSHEAEILARKTTTPATDTITSWISYIHSWAKSKGWWPGAGEDPGYFNNRNVGEQIANFHSEITEAWEEWRAGVPLTQVYVMKDGERVAWCPVLHGCEVKPEGFGIELADTVIRIMDTCGAYGIDLNDMLAIKMAYNERRANRHGGKLA